MVLIQSSFASVVAAFGLLVNIVVATGPLNGLPVLNGPVPVVPQVLGSKKHVGEFIHPGLWHTHDDLERIRLGVVKGQEPWKSANDVRAAYQNALMWYITKNQSHWDRSTTILDAWGTNLTSIIGTDTSLLVGLEGDMFANAAEIMRWEGGWIEAGAKASGGTGFSNQLYWLFARQSIIIGQANYGMVSIKALLSFAVYLDDVTLYNYAVYAFQNDLCAGIYGNFHPETGQSAETGRDQGHAQGGLGWTAEAARIMQSQGTDVYSLGDNLLLKAAEYTAKYNLGYDVPYDPKFYRCEAILINGPWALPSNISRGVAKPPPKVWDILYYQYVVKRGLRAPYTTKMKTTINGLGGEGNPGTTSPGDHPSWGDLIWSYDKKGKFLNDNGRTIWGGGEIGPNGKGMINSA
ncbi:hypothetical protein TrVFT333_002620 [Trichoderma virens FT-333]|nr:hypothetical protein TrVFT333_002620 [Trichoderma virens FT-333]